jgi:Gram-negative bacterial TonB protein C-terminal
MSSFSFLTAALVASIILPIAGVETLTQTATASDSQQEGPVMSSLSPPVYPPVAKQAHVAGDVELELKVKADGSLESATVTSGPPLLTQAALDSAKHSLFECRNCGAEGIQFHVLYTFQLGPTSYCTDASDTSKIGEKQETYPKVAQERNHITLIDQPVGTCDPSFKIVERKVRSVKCLFLWKCGSADWHEEPLYAPH